MTQIYRSLAESDLAEANLSITAVEDAVIVALARAKHSRIATLALLPMLAHEYDMPVRGAVLTKALKNLRDEGVVYRCGKHYWALDHRRLQARPRP